MPYMVKIDLQSPYIPKGLKILDERSEFHKSVRVDGENFSVDRAMSGLPWEPKVVPQQFSVEVAAADLPDFFSLRIGYGVTDIFRDKVEELEPDVHQFFPVEITAKGRESPVKRVWLLHICNRVDAIDPIKTSVPLGFGGLFYSTEGLSVGRELGFVLRKEAVAGKCMWVDCRYKSGEFFSDELFAFVEQSRLTKLRSWHVCAE